MKLLWWMFFAATVVMMTWGWKGRNKLVWRLALIPLILWNLVGTWMVLKGTVPWR